LHSLAGPHGCDTQHGVSSPKAIKETEL